MSRNNAQNIKILPLTIDGVFKMYFENPDNLPQLKSFLMAHIEINQDDLAKIKVLNPGLPKSSIDEKGFTVDLLLETKSGNDIHVEMQTSEKAYFKERVQLYNARKAGKQLKRGQQYNRAKRTISLIVIDFDLFGDYNRYHETLFVRRDNGEIFTKTQEINIVNLTKVSESQCKNQYLWGKLFKVKTMEELNMLANESEEMKAATEKLLEVSADEMAQAYADSEDYRLYQIHMEKVAAEEAKAKARAEAEEAKAEFEEAKAEFEEAKVKAKAETAAEKLVIAKKLFTKGMSATDVIEITGLSQSQIDEIKSEQGILVTEY